MNTYTVILHGNDTYIHRGQYKATNIVQAIKAAYEATEGMTIEAIEHVEAAESGTGYI